MTLIDHNGQQSIHDHCEHPACGDSEFCCRCLNGLVLQTTGTLAQATEVIKQLVDATAAVEWGGGMYGTSCPNCGIDRYRHDPERHDADCELDAQLTKARKFLESLT